MDEANLILLAGPNGAGKSTAAPDLLRGAFHVDEFVNADVIARGLSAFHPEGAAISAGRVMLARLDELTSQRLPAQIARRAFRPRRNHSQTLWRRTAQLFRAVRPDRQELAFFRQHSKAETVDCHRRRGSWRICLRSRSLG
jgi:hypothetical protein